MENEFKPGDTVYLKSGSSKMVVEAVVGDQVKVVYSVFNTKEIARDNLPAIILRKCV